MLANTPKRVIIFTEIYKKLTTVSLTKKLVSIFANALKRVVTKYLINFIHNTEHIV